MKCTEKALYFAGPQVPWLSALSAEDGRFLWKHPARDLHIVIRDDGLYTIGPATAALETKKLDPLTGEVLATYETRRRSCTRATGSVDSIFFRGHEGSGRFDVATGKTAWISAMRPSCQIGVMIAAGHLYWIPWACDCDLQLFGMIACGPAGDFVFDQKATEAERLKTRSGPFGHGGRDAKFAAADWPTYRADNTRSGPNASDGPGAGQAALAVRGARAMWSPRHRSRPEGWSSSAAPTASCGPWTPPRQERWTAYTGGAVQLSADHRRRPGAGRLRRRLGLRLRGRHRAAPVAVPRGARRAEDPVLRVAPLDLAGGQRRAGRQGHRLLRRRDHRLRRHPRLRASTPATGAIRWQNNTAGHLDTFSRRGVACQGEMLLAGGRLYLAGGNTVSPGVFDAATASASTTPPTSMGATAPRGRELVLVGGQVKAVGQPLYSRPEAPVFDPSVKWDAPVVHAANASFPAPSRRGEDRRWFLVAESAANGEELWVQPLPAEPVRWGMAVDAKGRVIVALRNGARAWFRAVIPRPPRPAPSRWRRLRVNSRARGDWSGRGRRA